MTDDQALTREWPVFNSNPFGKTSSFWIVDDLDDVFCIDQNNRTVVIKVNECVQVFRSSQILGFLELVQLSNRKPNGESPKRASI
jgi:hypothetical protein